MASPQKSMGLRNEDIHLDSDKLAIDLFIKVQFLREPMSHLYFFAIDKSIRHLTHVVMKKSLQLMENFRLLRFNLG
jgi:hypothetical protein